MNEKNISAKDKMIILKQLIIDTGAEFTTEMLENLNNISYFLASDNNVEFKSVNKKDADFRYKSDGINRTIEANTTTSIKTMEEFIRYLNHEIEHAQTSEYIKNEIAKGNRASKEVKFLNRLLASYCVL
jgi:hypothetical protein